MKEHEIDYSRRDFEARLRKAALKFLEIQGRDVTMDNFRGWIVVKEEAGYDTGHVFIKLAGDRNSFEALDDKELRKEFEEVAAAWLSATDIDDAVGPIRGDIINFNVINDDRALLRWAKDAINERW